MTTSTLGELTLMSQLLDLRGLNKICPVKEYISFWVDVVIDPYG